MTKLDFSIPVDLDSFKRTGWQQPDVTLITGDVFVDHPSFGVAIVARLLEDLGMKVLVISQPTSPEELSHFPPPRYFFGITSGNLDSMVSNYTASGKPRNSDSYSFEGGKRPNRACIVYSNWVKSVFKDTPIVLGGLEASLRRFGHYDWWQNKVRHSILLDSKADLLIYGMSELTLNALIALLKRGVPFQKIKYLEGTVFYTTNPEEIPQNYIPLNSYDEIKKDTKAYNRAFKIFYNENTTSSTNGLFQPDGSKYVVQNPPSRPLTEKEMDRIYALPFTKEVHPNLKHGRELQSLESVRSTIVTHRGCYGECNFCAIALHQGRTVQSRSITSIRQEVVDLTQKDSFKGTISDLGGPTANMYGYECKLKEVKGPCKNKRCLFPDVCESLKPNHEKYLVLLDTVSKIEGVKHVFISSGIRPDLIYADKYAGKTFLEKLTLNHTSGYLKLAPEHFSKTVLTEMGKDTQCYFERIFKDFYRLCSHFGKNQFITAYLMVGHPGEGLAENLELVHYIQKFFKDKEQPVQIFTPTPSTISTTIYYTGHNPFTGKSIKVVRQNKERNLHKKRALLKLREDEENEKNEGFSKRKTGKRVQAKRGQRTGGTQRRRSSHKG